MAVHRASAGPEAEGAATEELVRLTSDLYRFVASSERIHRLAEGHPRLEGLLRWGAELSERLAAARDGLRAELAGPLERATGSLGDLLGELGRHRPAAPEVRRRWASLGRDYEALLARLRRERVAVPANLPLGHLKPRNYARNLFHVACGVLVVLVYEVVGSRTGVLAAGGALLLAIVGLEALRRASPWWNEHLVERTFGRISRPNEAHRIPAATWYLVALIIGVAFLPRHAIEVGTLVLAFGDPAASLAGKRWGRLKIRGEKSLAGSAAFVALGFVVAAGFLLLFGPGLGLGRVLGVSLAAAGAGALAELFSDRLDDNFTVPLVAGAVAALLL